MRADILTDLRRIHIQLQDLCLIGEFLRISEYTVTEAHADRDQKIALTDTVIRCLGSMHAKHSGIPRIGTVECSFSHQGIADRCVNLIYKFAQILARAGDHCSATDKYIRFFCFPDQL